MKLLIYKHYIKALIANYFANSENTFSRLLIHSLNGQKWCYSSEIMHFFLIAPPFYLVMGEP